MFERMCKAMGRRTAILGALAMAAGFPSGPANAAGLASDITYSTTARLSGEGLPVDFEGVTDATYDGEGPIDLGQFVVREPATGGDVVFSDAAFAIEFDAPAFHKVEPQSDTTSALTHVQYDGVFSVEGTINGTVFADGSSDLVATLDGVEPKGIGVMSLDTAYVDALPFPVTDVEVPAEISLASGPGGTDGVDVSAQIGDSLLYTTTAVEATVQPVPEPTSVAVFLAGACGLVVARRRR